MPFFLFMLAVISGIGVANGSTLTPRERAVLNACLPAPCVAVGVALAVLYATRAGPTAYLPRVVPVTAAGAYLAYVLSLQGG